jgi:hypothetical protein
MSNRDMKPTGRIIEQTDPEIPGTDPEQPNGVSYSETSDLHKNTAVPISNAENPPIRKKSTKLPGSVWTPDKRLNWLAKPQNRIIDGDDYVRISDEKDTTFGISIASTLMNEKCPKCKELLSPSIEVSILNSKAQCNVVWCVVFFWLIFPLFIMCCIFKKESNFRKEYPCQACGHDVTGVFDIGTESYI